LKANFKAFWVLPIVAVLTASLLFASAAQYTSALPKLSVSVKVAKDPISRGNTQTVSVKVTSGGKGVGGASVSSKVVYTSSLTKSFSGKTDSMGSWSFSWQIGGNSNPGIFKVLVTASKSGFDSSTGSASFTVITKSGKSKKY